MEVCGRSLVPMAFYLIDLGNKATKTPLILYTPGFIWACTVGGDQSAPLHFVVTWEKTLQILQNWLQLGAATLLKSGAAPGRSGVGIPIWLQLGEVKSDTKNRFRQPE